MSSQMLNVSTKFRSIFGLLAILLFINVKQIQSASSSRTDNDSINKLGYRLAKLKPQSSLVIPSFLPTMANDDQLLKTFQDQLLMAQPIFQSTIPYVYNRKRSCLINAGLSNNCDFRDFISAANARRIWESQSSPGKRSINPLQYLNRNRQIEDLRQRFNWPQIEDNNHNYKNQLTLENEFDDHQRQNIEFQDPSSIKSRIGLNNKLTNSINKRMQCLSGLPGGDCENSWLGSESFGQDFFRPGGRNPGKR